MLAVVCAAYWFDYIMSTLREKKLLQREQQAHEVAAGERTKIINTPASMPMPDPKNDAVFAVEEERRKKAGEDSQALVVPDKGKAPVTRSATAAWSQASSARVPPQGTFMRDAIASGATAGRQQLPETILAGRKRGAR